eukprot:5121090-Pleurochrysis_carterae.AAC.1
MVSNFCALRRRPSRSVLSHGLFARAWVCGHRGRSECTAMPADAVGHYIVAAVAARHKEG